jgi:hypothetical protein
LDSETTVWPRWGGTSTSRSYSAFSPSREDTTPAEGSTDSTLKKVVRPIPRSSMMGWISLDAASMVNARFKGDSSVTSVRSRRPRRRRYSSSMKTNSIGAGGHR